MGRQIHVDLERTIPAPPARVHGALADHHGRARVLPDNYLDRTIARDPPCRSQFAFEPPTVLVGSAPIR
jgi:uncharacterized protein YndB with AHSA1/START domain